MNEAALVLAGSALNGEGRTAALHKGLLVEADARSLGEEGMGFGVPAIVAGNRTYLSFDADIITPDSKNPHWRKTFFMNAVGTLKKRGRTVPGGSAYAILEMAATLYKASRAVQRFASFRWSKLGISGTELVFERTEPVAVIPVTYRISGCQAEIAVDLTGADDISGSKIYVLNEQGARAFPEYCDDAGNVLAGEAIGGWVKVEAGLAAFRTAEGGLSFSLRQVPGAPLFRGREVTCGALSWAGFTYDVTRFKGAVFRYKVEI